MSDSDKTSTGSSSVAVVDDEIMVRKAVSQSIESLGHSVAVYGNAFECIEALKTSPCDLIVSDINMPEMDGIELLKRVKEFNPAIPVLLVTGYGDIPLAVAAVKCGAADFLEKPLTEEILLPKIESLLRAKEKIGNLPITQAEMVVLKWVASGKSNKEIAFLLGRSIRTVENHRHRLMQKLNAGSVADLTKIAVAHGVVKIDSE